MPIASTTAVKVSTGSCPHGLPHGACPICSGMGGGGGSVRRDEPKANEMSYDECFAIWQQMKAEKQVKIDKSVAFQARQVALHTQIQTQMVAFAHKIANASRKVADFAQKISNSHPILSKPVVLVAKKILVPILNTMKNVTMVVAKAVKFVGQKLADISDKLNAVFGEFKNSTLKKMSDKFHDFRKKVHKFFIINPPKRTDDEENKLETEKKIFNIKNLFQKIQRNLINKKDKQKYAGN